MSSTRYRWIQDAPSPMLVGKQPRSAQAQIHALRNRGAHPLARWRMAVAVVVEPLILAIVPLLLWGMIGAKATPLVVGIALTVSLILLVCFTLVISAFATDARAWSPGEGR
jgi:hypothetical protein